MRRAPLLVGLLALCLSTPLMSQQIEGNLTPGGFALVPVFSSERPNMRFGLQPIAILDEQSDSGVWIGLVGIDLLTPPGDYLLTRSNQGREQEDDLFNIPVQPIEHGLRPSRTITTRIEEYFRNALVEDAEDFPASDLVGDWQQSKLFSLPFHVPLERATMDTEAVGSYVRYPSGALEPINALFLRSNGSGARVLAPSGGIINRVEMPEGRLTNTVVVMDHGQGVFSILKGEFSLEVGIGDIVEAGADIGLFSATNGRADEDIFELSWQLILNGDVIDPSHFLNLDLSAYREKLATDAEAYFAAIEIAEQNNALLLESSSEPTQEQDSDQIDSENSNSANATLE